MRQNACTLPRRVLARTPAAYVQAQRRSLATEATSLLRKDCSSITPPYNKLIQNLAHVRRILGDRPLTLAEKILYSHIHEPERTLANGGIKRGETYLQLNPERVAMQDASAQ